MRRFRIWHLGLAVLWVAFLAWIAVTGRSTSTSEAAYVLAFWIAASAISLSCTLLVGRPLARRVMQRLDRARHGVGVLRRLAVVLGALATGMCLACLFVGLIGLLCVVMEMLEPYLRGLR
jgi:hypothetical protein